jgi:hypothetical protein
MLIFITHHMEGGSYAQCCAPNWREARVWLRERAREGWALPHIKRLKTWRWNHRNLRHLRNR